MELIIQYIYLEQVYYRYTLKIYHGLASVKDYEVQRGIKEGGMIIAWEDPKTNKVMRMTLTKEDLERKWQIHKLNFVNKEGVRFQLIDFPFITDDEKAKRSQEQKEKEKQLKLI